MKKKEGEAKTKKKGRKKEHKGEQKEKRAVFFYGVVLAQKSLGVEVGMVQQADLRISAVGHLGESAVVHLSSFFFFFFFLFLSLFLSFFRHSYFSFLLPPAFARGYTSKSIGIASCNPSGL